MRACAWRVLGASKLWYICEASQQQWRLLVNRRAWHRPLQTFEPLLPSYGDALSADQERGQLQGLSAE
jgi:hypothetical protein